MDFLQSHRSPEVSGRNQGATKYLLMVMNFLNVI